MQRHNAHAAIESRRLAKRPWWWFGRPTIGYSRRYTWEANASRQLRTCLWWAMTLPTKSSNDGTDYSSTSEVWLSDVEPP